MPVPLAIGGLDSLNAAPLQWGLARGRASRALPLQLTLRTPAASAAALADGSADVALVPSIAVPLLPGARVVPGLAIAARRRVRSVLLLATRPLAALRTVAVDASSTTSVALLRILLARRFGAHPEFVPRAADATAMLRDHDAALLIADAALTASAPGVEAHDLATLWAEWTGLPFVFALWVVRDGVDAPGLEAALLDSRAEGLENLPALVSEFSARPGWPGGPALTAYLSELLHYALGPEEEASLARFYSEAGTLGLLPAIAPDPIRARRVGSAS